MNKPLMLSIYMPTYFHEKYVSRAIDSIYNQKVNFDFELIIVDDASKDKTVEIIKKYSQKFQNIRIIVNKENIGLTANMYLGKSMCTGKYITSLSGDDYYLDEFKLQKQVDFLENHNEYYSVCCRLALINSNTENGLVVVPNIEICNRKFTKDMFLNGINLPLNGIVSRNGMLVDKEREILSIMPKVSKFIDDITDNLLLLELGDSYILPDVMIGYNNRNDDSTENNFNSINDSFSIFYKSIELLNNLEKELNCKEDLFIRYKIIIRGVFKYVIKHFLFIDFIKVYITIPLRYRYRLLLFRSFF